MLFHSGKSALSAKHLDSYILKPDSSNDVSPVPQMRGICVFVVIWCFQFGCRERRNDFHVPRHLNFQRYCDLSLA